MEISLPECLDMTYYTLELTQQAWEKESKQEKKNKKIKFKVKNEDSVLWWKKQMDGLMGEWVDRFKNAWIDGGWMDQLTDGWVIEWIAG